MSGTPERPAPLVLPVPVIAAASVALAVFAAVGAAQRLDGRATLSVSAAVAMVVFGVTAFAGPRRTSLPAALLCAAATVVLANGTASDIGWFGLCLLGGWVATVAPPVPVACYAVAAVTALAVQIGIGPRDPGWAAWVVGTLFSVVGFWFARRQRDLLEQLRAAQAGLELRVQAEERNRIARELHDVIAHSLTVSLLHVSSARLAVQDEPEAALDALLEAERLGRESLDEVRHAVGLLHHPDAPDPRAPLPGSTDVPALVERFRRAGADVALDVDGTLDDLPATVGLATHRILQESLTNAVKHAPSAPTRVRVRVDAGAVSLDVDSAGRPGTGAGHGLVSMRERAESVGGSLSAGPGGNGWLVRAHLPLLPSAHGTTA